MASIDKVPASFELWVLKWIFGPFLLITLGYIMFADHKNRVECETACSERGYEGFRHAEGPRFSDTFICTCLTEEDLKIKDRIPKGVRIY